MATLAQLLKLQHQIEADQEKLEQKREKRSKLIHELGFKYGDYFKGRGENFVTVDGVPCRLWVSVDGRIELEDLRF
jgi:hypothetical protein